MSKSKMFVMVIIICMGRILLADSWASKTPIPTMRHGIGGGAVNNQLYAIGGSYQGGPFDINEVFNPATNSWNFASGMFVGCSGLPSGGCIGNVLYIAGGNYYGSDCILATNMAYNAGTHLWQIKCSMPTPRYDLAFAVVNGNLYAIGGFGYNGVTGAVEMYDTTTNNWVFKAGMPTPRMGLACAAFNGMIYAIGGYSGTVFYNITEVYDPGNNSWQNATSMPTPRGFCACGVVDSLIYVIGGYNGSHVGTNEAYNPTTNTWITRASMPTPRKGAAFGVINGKIYVAGGSNTSYVNANEEYSPYLDIDESGNAEAHADDRVYLSMSHNALRCNFYDNDQSQITVILYDATGRQIQEWHVRKNHELTLVSDNQRDFAKGVYFVKINGNNLQTTRKVICME